MNDVQMVQIVQRSGVCSAVYGIVHFCHDIAISVQLAQTDRQTGILLTEIKVITDLFVIVIREIYVHVYTRMLVC